MIPAKSEGGRDRPASCADVSPANMAEYAARTSASLPSETRKPARSSFGASGAVNAASFMLHPKVWKSNIFRHEDFYILTGKREKGTSDKSRARHTGKCIINKGLVFTSPLISLERETGLNLNSKAPINLWGNGFFTVNKILKEFAYPIWADFIPPHLTAPFRLTARFPIDQQLDVDHFFFRNQWPLDWQFAIYSQAGPLCQKLDKKSGLRHEHDGAEQRAC